MIKLMNRTTGNCIAFRINGELTTEDVEKEHTLLQATLKNYDDLNIMVVAEDFEGYADFEALKVDMQNAFNVYKHFNRLAIVGAGTLEQVFISMFSVFTKTEERLFDVEDIGEAWAWTCGEVVPAI